MSHPIETHQRQIHLDFHTSQHIPGIAADFDAREFAATMKRAHVNSVTTFAKCHHGYTYYPTKVGTAHPELVPAGRDLLGEQIEALHREGIRCPIYMTVGWDALLTAQHPEWRSMFKNGLFGDWNTGHPGQWAFVNWLHPDFQQHLEDLTREVLDRYGKEVDGFFYDICFFPKGACWSPESRKFREKHHLLDESLAGHERFMAKAHETFSKRYWDVIRAARPEATVFFNAGTDTFLEPGLGGRARYRQHEPHGNRVAAVRFLGLLSLPAPRPLDRPLGQAVAGDDRPFPNPVGRLRRHQAAARARIRVLPPASARRRQLRRRPTPAARRA